MIRSITETNSFKGWISCVVCGSCLGWLLSSVRLAGVGMSQGYFWLGFLLSAVYKRHRWLFLHGFNKQVVDRTALRRSFLGYLFGVAFWLLMSGCPLEASAMLLWGNRMFKCPSLPRKQKGSRKSCSFSCKGIRTVVIGCVSCADGFSRHVADVCFWVCPLPETMRGRKKTRRTKGPRNHIFGGIGRPRKLTTSNYLWADQDQLKLAGLVTQILTRTWNLTLAEREKRESPSTQSNKGGSY